MKVVIREEERFGNSYDETGQSTEERFGNRYQQIGEILK